MNPDRCTGCEICAERCYFDAVSLDSDISEIDQEKCMGCGVCAITCEDAASTMKQIRSEDFRFHTRLNRVEKLLVLAQRFNHRS